jgi:hypothetical protein
MKQSRLNNEQTAATKVSLPPLPENDEDIDFTEEWCRSQAYSDKVKRGETYGGTRTDIAPLTDRRHWPVEKQWLGKGYVAEL